MSEEATEPTDRPTPFWSSEELQAHMETEHGGAPTGGSQPDLVEHHRALHDSSGMVYGARHIHAEFEKRA